MRWIAICAVLAMSQAASADELRGKAVSVADGDTITVLDGDKVQHKIGLQGIDAPDEPAVEDAPTIKNAEPNWFGKGSEEFNKWYDTRRGEGPSEIA